MMSDTNSETGSHDPDFGQVLFTNKSNGDPGTTKTKIEMLHAKLKENTQELEEKECTIEALTKENLSLREELGNHAAVIHSLQQQAEIEENRRDQLSRDKVPKTELVKSQEKIADLEATLKSVIEQQSVTVADDEGAAARQDLQNDVESLQLQKQELDREVDLLQQETEKLRSELTSGAQPAAAAEREGQLQAFLNSLVSHINALYPECRPTQEDIESHVRRMSENLQEKIKSGDVEERTKQAPNSEFDECEDSARKADWPGKRLSKHSERTENIYLRERVKALQDELVASEVARQGLRGDKEKFYRYMQKLAQVLNMERIRSETAIDVAGESLVARAQQLSRVEATGGRGRSQERHSPVRRGSPDRITTSLQRQLRQLQSRLEAKDNHIESLRKKVIGLEEELDRVGRKEAKEVGRGENYEVLRLQRLLDDSGAENASLKAQLLEYMDLKSSGQSREVELSELSRTVDKLERVRQRQAKRINELSRGRSRERAGDAIVVREQEREERLVDALSGELRITRQSLEDSRQREKQLLDFRSMVSRMLDLDLASLSVPDYEIMTRLERVVHGRSPPPLLTRSRSRSRGRVEKYALEERDNRTGYDEVKMLLGPERTKSTRTWATERSNALSHLHRRSYDM